MRRRIETWVVAMAIGAVVTGCSRGEQSATPADNGVPDEIIVGFVTEQTDSGLAQWKLSAPEARRYSMSKALVMEKPTIQFFDRAGVVKTVLVSDSGLFHDDTRDLLAYGNVVVTASRGDVLETDTLRYLNERDRIVTESFVKLTRDNDVLTGYGLECDRDISQVVIKRDPKARIVGGQPNDENEEGNGAAGETP